MEDESEIFYANQIEDFNMTEEFNLPEQNNPLNLSPNWAPNNEPYEYPQVIKPFNFMQLTPQQECQMNNFSQKNKHLNGIQILFGLEQSNSNDENFLEGIDTKVFENSDTRNNLNLNQFFTEHQVVSQQSQFNAQIQELTQKMSEIQKKYFSGISMNKTVGPAFYEHFQNFTCLRDSSEFQEEFSNSLQKMIYQAKKIKKNGNGLILMIYEFWMKMFHQFIRQIWKHSQKYSLDLFKKTYKQDSQQKSLLLSQFGDKQKRKPWATPQLKILEKHIDSKIVFSTERLELLSKDLGRTPASISSKVQKLLKNRKEKADDISIEKKLEQVLRVAAQPISKLEVIERIRQTYEMGLQDSWKKSISQLLSSKKNIERIKGKYMLELSSQPQQLGNTLKDKLIRCFLNCEDHTADLKTLVHIYHSLYELNENPNMNAQYFKKIQSNISKTLCRYDIFNKDKAKTFYKIIEDGQKMDEIESFLY